MAGNGPAPCQFGVGERLDISRYICGDGDHLPGVNRHHTQIEQDSRGDQAVFVILPIIFLAVGLGVGLPLLLMGRRASNAQYFITTSSAFIVSPAMSWSGKRVVVILLKNLQQITLAENRDGTTGSLTFGVYPQTVNARYSGGWWLDSMPAFWNIERPLEVYQLIRKQMNEA